MYCPKCRTENPDQAKFCGACGAILTPAPPAPPEFPEQIMPKTSGLAIAALVLGILSIFTCLLTGIPSIICGIISLIKIEKSGGRITGKGFSLTGIILPVVVLPVIALLMGILMPALSRTKTQARSVACMANLKQWGLVLSMYSNDNNGYFVPDANWLEPLRTYHRNNQEILLCPIAKRPGTGVEGTTHTAWTTPEGQTGSYGLNGWITNPPKGRDLILGQFPAANHWRTPNVRGTPNIPLMMDARHFFAYPLETDLPPQTENIALQSPGHMQRICINRHNGYINTAFLDFSVRRAGLKELWTLKWHKAYNLSGPWTTKGGVQPNDWPQWMKNLRDY